MKSLITFMLLFGVLKASAQHSGVQNIAGGSAKIGNYLVDFNVGEFAAIESYEIGKTALTQGFLQPTAMAVFETDIEVIPDMSPNDDKQGNETLHIRNIEKYPDNAIEIFNRWGNMVFTMKGYNNDDHVFKGKANTGILIDDAELPDGTYYYVLRVNDSSFPNQVVLNGFIVIKRK